MADHQASFRLAVERGVKIAMGTDSGVGPHATNAEELARMVEAGMTPMQAIVATTRSAAECARIAHLTGSLEVGKRADLLAVDGDPLADVSILQDASKLAVIMRDGQTFKNVLAQSGSELSTARAASVPIG
jgi:imidazolonepropionase-like amidohydrolase